VLKKLLLLFVAIVVFLFFWWICARFIDSDFGWHVKMGELILKHGIPKSDPFSYTMPSFPFIDHEWLTNIILFVIHERLGYVFLGMLFAAIATAIPFVVISGSMVSFAFIPSMLMYAEFIGRMGIRVQVLGWLFIAVFIRILTDKQRYGKGRWLLPAVMILWTNMHGSFPLGLLIFYCFFVVRSLQQRKIIWSDVILGIVLTLSTFITPYGIRAWEEVKNQMLDTNLHRYILEWFPFYALIDVSYFISAAVLGALLLCYYKKETLWWYLAFVGVLFIAGLTALRHMPLFVIAAGYLIAKYLGLLFDKTRDSAFYYSLCIVAIGVFLLSVTVFLKDTARYNPEDFYPAKAITFIKNHRIDGTIFAPYVWGGYLIWQLPERKVFIDGRMPSFAFYAPAGESDSVFKEYIQLMQGNKMKTIFQKYHIRYLLLQKLPTRKKDVFDELFIQLGLVLPDIKDVGFFKAIQKIGAEEIYTDNTAVLYELPKIQTDHLK
jgi:hypothetical protein